MTEIRIRAGALLFGMAAALTLATIPVGAQEPANADPAARRAGDPSRRVPPFFGQVGLTPEQRESIYKVRSKHQQKIDELKKQMAQAQAEMITECEAILNDTQKKLLVARRDASAAKSKQAKAAPSASPKPKTAEREASGK